LLENTEKYSHKPAQIMLTLKKKHSNIELIVKDFGCGIDIKERDKVFDKFYRIGNEETRRTKGTGLGLYIVKKVVLIHKGNIEIKSNIPNGTIFTIKLPY